MKKSNQVLGISLIALGLASGNALAAQRTFVSILGSDSNTASSCGNSTPCRGFAAAMTVTDTGGEIVVQTSGGYGPVSVTKSVSLIAAPGIYAGISVFSGAGIAVAASGANVVLRGLTINGLGGAQGVYITDASKVSVENCVVGHFAAGSGVVANSAVKLRVVDSLFRDNAYGIWMQSAATGTVSGSNFLGNDYGIYVNATPSGTTSLAVSDTVVADGYAGITAYGAAGGATGRIEVMRTQISNLAYGISSNAPSGTTVVSVGDSLISGNTVGLYQANAGATLRSLGNNMAADNGSNYVGTISSLTPL